MHRGGKYVHRLPGLAYNASFSPSREDFIHCVTALNREYDTDTLARVIE